MRKASTELSQSRGLKRRPLLRTSSPLKPKINRGLTFGVVQQTGARHIRKQVWQSGDRELEVIAEIPAKIEKENSGTP